MLSTKSGHLHKWLPNSKTTDLLQSCVWCMSAQSCECRCEEPAGLALPGGGTPLGHPGRDKGLALALQCGVKIQPRFLCVLHGHDLWLKKSYLSNRLWICREKCFLFFSWLSFFSTWGINWGLSWVCLQWFSAETISSHQVPHSLQAVVKDQCERWKF